MNRQVLFVVLLFLAETSLAAAQLPRRDINQIRQDTTERNRAIEEHDRNNQGDTTILSTSTRGLFSGKIPGSEIRKYVLAAQVQTEVKVLSIESGDTLLVDDGTNKTVVRIIGTDAPEAGQVFYIEAINNLSDLLVGKRVILRYSLHNLKDEDGYFPARVFLGATDIGLKILEKGFVWYNEKDKFLFEKKDDAENKQMEAKARLAKVGIWKEEKPQKPSEYRKKMQKEKKSAADK